MGMFKVMHQFLLMDSLVWNCLFLCVMVLNDGLNRIIRMTAISLTVHKPVEEKLLDFSLMSALRSSQETWYHGAVLSACAHTCICKTCRCWTQWWSFVGRKVGRKLALFLPFYSFQKCGTKAASDFCYRVVLFQILFVTNADVSMVGNGKSRSIIQNYWVFLRILSFFLGLSLINWLPSQNSILHIKMGKFFFLSNTPHVAQMCAFVFLLPFQYL